MAFFKKSNEKVIAELEKEIIKNQKKILAKAQKSKKDAITALLMLQAIYVLEIEEGGKELTSQDLQQMELYDLVGLLETYLRRLKEELGDES